MEKGLGEENSAACQSLPIGTRSIPKWSGTAGNRKDFLPVNGKW